MNTKGILPGIASFRAEVLPGETIEISLPLKSPMLNGAYQGYWYLQSADGQIFGVGDNASEPLAIKIAVIGNSNDITSATAPITLTPQPARCQSSPEPTIENTVLRLINQERIKQGLILLIPQSQLTRAARTHSQDMACNDFLAHQGSDGSNALDRLKIQHYTYTQADENIFATKNGDKLTEEAIGAWLKNDNNRANLLSDIYTQIGIGYASNPNSEYGNYLDVIFAKP
jgi:uncharacterized protein YkwD